jgi:alpha-1,6-mannosyltransferase
VALAVTFAAATARIPLARHFPEATISVDFVKMLGPGWERPTALYLALVVSSFAWYGLALAAVWGGARVPALLSFGFPLLFAGALLAMYPPTAVDLFHYHADARTLWVHGANPLVTAPSAFDYPIGISWMDQPSPYGPLWSLLMLPIGVLPGDANYMAGLYGLKLLAAASLLGCTWLVWLLARRARPGSETLAVVLFAWNPFVLLRVVGNGHNDLVMMFLVLLALERAQRASWGLAFQAIAGATLIKFAAGLVGPPLLLYAWLQIPGGTAARVRALWLPLLWAALTVVVAYAPFWEGSATFDTLRGQAELSVTSSAEVLAALLGNHEDPALQDLTRTITRVAFVLLYLPFAWWSRRSFDRLLVGSFTILLLYLLVGASWYRPWYMLWPAAIAAARPRSWLAPTFLAATFAGLFPDLVEQFRWFWGFLNTSLDRMVIAPTAIQFGPPLAVWAWGVWRYRSWALDVAAPAPPPASASGGLARLARSGEEVA